jgi:hypothetical protein
VLETPAVVPQPTVDPFATLLSDIKDFGGQQKYVDTATALASIAPSQEHIQVQSAALTAKDTEIATLREELTKRKTVEDFVSTLNPTVPTPQPPVTPVVEPGLDAEATNKLISDAFTARNATDVATANFDKVVSKLTEQFGDKASAAIEARAKELSMTSATLKVLAQENPTMVLSLFSDVKAPSTATPAVATHTSALQTEPATTLPKPPEGVSFSRGGATQSQLMESFKAVRDATHTKLGVES